MESSEEDAGAATNASRRASAREKDVGRTEDGGTSGGISQKTSASEAGAASETTSMSEEVFDGDSVPSPSPDHNTSTEALLDMIDEIVEGPGAPKRRPLSSDNADADDVNPSDHSNLESGPSPSESDATALQPSILPPTSPTKCENIASESLVDSQTRSQKSPTRSDNMSHENLSVTSAPASPTRSDNRSQESLGETLAPVSPTRSDNMPQENLGEIATPGSPNRSDNMPHESSVDMLVLPSKSDNIIHDTLVDTQTPASTSNSANVLQVTISNTELKCTSRSVARIGDVNKICDELSQASSSVPSQQAVESNIPLESVEINLVTEVLRDCPPCNIPSSSVVETVQNVSDVSESQMSERTIKCATSSDSRDNVIVESAESTSSDNSVSEGRVVVTEATTRSPLRRRLVRPAPSDRRPDSTVSSTVDSQTVDIDTSELKGSESVAKDVSSSSDAVPPVYGNVKPEEIKNVSEISVCKAETSMCPPKKIKLVRQKPVTFDKDNTEAKPVLNPEHEIDQCQSTSESIPSVSLEPESNSSEHISSRMELEVENGVKKDSVTSKSSVPIPHESTSQIPQCLNECTDENPQDCEVSVQPNPCLAKTSHSERERAEASPCLAKPLHPESDPSIKINLLESNSSEILTTEIKTVPTEQQSGTSSSSGAQDLSDSIKQVPKLTIKLGNKQAEEIKSPIPKLTIRPIRPPTDKEDYKRDFSEQVPNITKLNIKPISKPAEKINDIHRKSSSSEISESESSENDESNSTSDQASTSDQGAPDVIPKVTIKMGKPGTESEGKFYTEKNIPKLSIKGIHHTENEEQDSVLKLIVSQPDDKQTEKVPKLTIKAVSKSEGQPLSPKLTIKSLKPPDNTNKESMVDQVGTQQILKIKTSTESYSSSTDVKENAHIPKITIKPIIKTDPETPKTPKKSSVASDSLDYIPLVTKLNIKPILKPTDTAESSDSCEENVPVVSKLNIKPIIKPIDEAVENVDDNIPVVSKLNIKPVMRPTDSAYSSNDQEVPVVSKLNIKPILKPTEIGDSESVGDNHPIISKLNIKRVLKPTGSGETSEGMHDKVPVVSKLNIKPILKPKDIEIDSSIEDVRKITKLNIKPLRNPEKKSSETKVCDDLNAEIEQNSIPVVMKLNIKPIVKPAKEDTLKESENQSSETGTSSDDNNDHIPVVTKINIKPILRPSNSEEATRSNVCNEESIPIVTKLNIKPLVKPEDNKSPSSPKKDITRCTESKSSSVPVVTKLNIKPVVRPEETDQQKGKTNNEDISQKNPPLVMKINIKAVTDLSSNENLSTADKKVNNIDDNSEHICNNVNENIPTVSKLHIKPITKPPDMEYSQAISLDTTEKVIMNCKPSISSHSPLSEKPKQNRVPDLYKTEQSPTPKIHRELIKSKVPCDLIPSKQSQDDLKMERLHDICSELKDKSGGLKVSLVETVTTQTSTSKQPSLTENCSLLKKLLGLDNRLEDVRVNANHSPVRIESGPPVSKELVNCEQLDKDRVKLDTRVDNEISKDPKQDKIIDMSPQVTIKLCSVQDHSKQLSENLTKPLEINISEKVANQSSGQDSPRIIIKINKTDHGPSAKIITEEMKRPETPKQNETSENTQEIINDKQVQKNTIQVNSKKKRNTDMMPTVAMGKRLRSSRIVENTDKSPAVKRNIGKQSSTYDTNVPECKEAELSVLETKRIKLGQLLSNKSLTVTPVPPITQISPQPMDLKQSGKTVNHTLLNNENCSKNGNSKLHNILSNLQAKQAQALSFNDINCSEKISITPELESNTSTRSSDVIDVTPVENSHLEVQTIISENSESRDFQIGSEEISHDPLEVHASKASSEVTADSPTILKPVELTPQPKKRGRPRKLPVSEGAKPLVLPVPALIERPQRSLRLSRDRPTILAKPRGRGRGRGAKKAEPIPPPANEPVVETATKFFVEEQKPAEEIDPTSSRIKLPRMTEALDKMPVCTTPLSSRRRSSTADLKLFVDAPELKVVLENTPMPKLEDVFVKSPETPSGRGRGGRGRGGRGRGAGRTPRGRGRGRGGGRGAMYMKETMGIYGRVCGPATTTVQLFEEETCMMDDNATPAKPSHLLDEDSQSSVKSSTNESSKMKKSKFADLFDSNKVWTAADVKEYMWPPPERPDVEHQVMMIQEQVAMFLSVKSFKRRYPELKRRTIGGEERDYVLGRGLVTEALCDLGITAVDASEVLDIMLSDYPHKYEEYRSHQRERQRAEALSEETTIETKSEPREDKIEMKVEMKPVEPKPEPSKIDLEKSRQDMAAAAIASASEWNARLNAVRRPACVDLQTMTVHRRRPAPAPAPPVHVRPPAGFYPHALLPGQYQHSYRVYTPDQLRYFPLNTAVAAPPAPPSPVFSSSDSEPEWGSSSSSEDSASDRLPAKRKKLTKTKRSSQTEAGMLSGLGGSGAGVKEEPREGEVELCRACKLRLEANRKYTHERFLVCANCNAKLHPSCVELGADTIRKCREYAWQCAECKTCCACGRPADDDKMLFCDLCDRGFHIYCVGLDRVPSGRWHCVECAICKSCGARDPNGPVGLVSTPSGSTTPMGSVTPAGGGEWHHQTRRGPGGHKMYSHSLCTPCARAYRIGRYCPLCERSFIGPKGTMQLVICKLCDRQHHQDCVRQSTSKLNVLDYTCGECRRGGITSRAAAARLAPRTIATLFMAKRRFNKYAHRQYLQSRLRAKSSHASETSNDLPDEAAESCDRADASDGSDAAPDEVSDPLDGAGDPAPDEAAAAVEALRMDFGD